MVEESSAFAGFGGLCLGLVLQDLLQDVVRTLGQCVRPPREPEGRAEEGHQYESPSGHVRRPPGAPRREDVRLMFQRACRLTELPDDAAVVSLELGKLLAGYDDRSLEPFSARGETL